MNRPEYLIIHHTGGTDANPLADTSHHTFEIVDDHHRRLWNFRSSLGHFIGYHYFIDLSGKVTQGRADYDEGAHTRGMNRKSIGICLAGNFDLADEPSKAQVEALRSLMIRLVNKHNIKLENIVPHRRFSNKTCYGQKLADDWAQSLLDPTPRSDIKEFETIELINELKRRIATGEL